MSNGFNTAFTYFRNSKEYEQYATSINDMLSKATASISDKNNIENAVSFLGSVAENERIKELQSITEFFQQKRDKLSMLNPQSSLFKLLNNSKSKIDDLENFYTDFTVALNIARRDTEETLTRIKTLQRDILDTSRNLASYQSDDYRFAIGSTMTSLINRITGNYSRGQIDDKDISAKLQSIVINIILEMGLVDRIQSGEDFTSTAATILIDIEKRAQEQLNKYIEQSGKNITFSDLSNEIFEEIEKKYLKELKENNPQSKIQQGIIDLSKKIDSPEMEKAVKNAETILNVNLSPNLNKIKGHTQEKGIKLESLLRQLRERVEKNKDLNSSLYRVHFTRMDTKSAHGNLNELIEGLFDEKVRANVATDVITYHFGFEVERNNKILDNFIHEISEELSSIGDFLSSSNKENKTLSEVLNTVNNGLTDTCNKIETFLEQTEEDDKKMFIQHETLKLSTLSMEEGHGFKGRTMSIFSYIQYLASISAGGFSGADTDSLTFIAYNLIPGAAADDQLDPLSRYFSIFAGMLMFDDVQNMAKEAINQVQSLTNKGQIEQLHLYNLNGLYVPSSMILQFVYEEMKKQQSIVESGFAAQASIILGQSSSSDFKVRAQAAKATKVRITFLTGFTNLINNMFQAISG